MSCLDHRWSRAVKGRRTGLWIRTCTVCGAQTRSETRPEQPDPVRVTEHRIEVKPTLDVRTPMERIATKQLTARLANSARLRLVE